MKSTYPISGIDCASCAGVITDTLKKLPGVQSCDVNFLSKQAEIEFDEEIISLTKVNDSLLPLGYEIKIPKSNHDHDDVDDHEGHLHGYIGI